MNIFTDGIRSDRWIGFAKNKLAALVDILGDVNKHLIISGYRIRLFSQFRTQAIETSDPSKSGSSILRPSRRIRRPSRNRTLPESDRSWLFWKDAIQKIEISAPPVIVVSHIEFPYVDSLGYEYVYYCEPYGAAARKLGPVGNSIHSTYHINQVKGGEYVAQGSGVIFSSLHDLYLKSECFFNVQEGLPPETIIALQTMVADFTARNMLPAGAELGMAMPSPGDPEGGWMVSVGNVVYASLMNTAGNGGGQFIVFAYAQNGHNSYEFFDMNSAEVRAQTGVNPTPQRGAHLMVKATYVYSSPVAGARMAVYCAAFGDSAPGYEKDLYSGVYFFDLLHNQEDDAHSSTWLSWSYVGRSRTYPLGNGWNLDYPLPMAGGPVVNVSNQSHKSCVYPNGSGGVNSLIYTKNAWLVGEYSFMPGAIATRNELAEFPPVVSDWQTWPTVFRGKDTFLCLAEKIAELGGKPTHEVVGVYIGSPSSEWVPIATTSLTLLAVRPLLVSLVRITMLGVVWIPGEGSYCAEFDSRVSAQWNVLGKISDSRLVRPIVGVFGKHEFSKMARDFSGSFPVTSWAGAHSYVEP